MTRSVICGSEFGRTPMMQGDDGRQHNAAGFTIWMAGGGVKAGARIGATDEIGLMAIEQPTHFHDLHATILAALGIKHEQLYFEPAAARTPHRVAKSRVPHPGRAGLIPKAAASPAMNPTRRQFLHSSAALALTSTTGFGRRPCKRLNRRIRVGQIGTQHGHAAGKISNPALV